MFPGEFQFIQPWMIQLPNDAPFPIKGDARKRTATAHTWEDPINKLRYLQCAHCLQNEKRDKNKKVCLYSNPERMRNHIDTCQNVLQWIMDDDRRLKEEKLADIRKERQEEKQARVAMKGEVRVVFHLTSRMS